MRKQQIENAAYEVATQVRAVEDTIDAALAEIAELQARIMRANSVARVGFATAHPVLEELAEAVKGLVGARGSVVGCHSALAEAKTRVPGLRTVSFGEGEECPDKKIAFTDLRIVA
jgi:chromosome segregation ATPase